MRKPIRTIECDQPLTACCFDLDGVTMAVGSSRGKVTENFFLIVSWVTTCPPGADLRLARIEGSLPECGCAQQRRAQPSIPAQGGGEDCESGGRNLNNLHNFLEMMTCR